MDTIVRAWKDPYFRREGGTAVLDHPAGSVSLDEPLVPAETLEAKITTGVDSCCPTTLCTVYFC